MKKKIENLKEKIQAKPKLYKFLKIFKIIFNFVVYLCALFFILSLSIGSCSNSKIFEYSNNTNNVKGMYDYNGNNYIFANSDFMDYRFIEGLLEYYYNNTGDDTLNLNNVNSGTGVIVQNNRTIKLCSAHVLNTSTGLYEHTFDIYALRITKSLYDSYVNPNNGLKCWRYVVDFLNIQDIITIQFTYTYMGNMNYNDVDDPLSLWNIVISNSNNSAYQNWYVYTSSRLSGETVLKDIFFDINHSSYQSGYTVGYQNGFSTGKQEGYTAGFTAGSSNVSSNPFDLIKKGFLAIANILDIEIIPGLNIGVLIFAPLIFSILIVIFRMIRG